MCVLCLSGLNAMQNLAALAAAATATQATATGSSAMTTSSSPLSALTSSGNSLCLTYGLRNSALIICTSSFVFSCVYANINSKYSLSRLFPHLQQQLFSEPHGLSWGPAVSGCWFWSWPEYGLTGRYFPKAAPALVRRITLL